jgi:ABC-type lipoprotein release transport system permease subunit
VLRGVPIVLTLGWRNLWRRPGRTVLTGSGAALGLGFLLTMLALGDGSHLQMIDAAARTVSGHVLLQATDYQRRRGVEQVVTADAAARAAAWARARPGVRTVLPRAFASGLVSSADGATGVSLTGVDPAAEAPVSRLATRLAEGRFLRPGDGAAAVVGSGVARVLKVRVGSRLVAMAQGPGGTEVRSTLLHVVGVVRSGIEEVDEGLVLLPLTALQGFLGLGGAVHQLSLILDDQGRAAEVASAARRAWPGLEALTWAEADPQLEAVIRIDDGGHYLFNGIFFVIIAFMMLNTLLMSVLERRREFALLGALGLPASRRLGMVLVEGALVAGLATLGGIGLGLGAHAYFHVHGLPLAWFTSQELETAGVVLEPIMYSALGPGRVVGAVLLVFGLTLGLALLAGRQAARPVDPNLLKAR